MAQHALHEPDAEMIGASRLTLRRSLGQPRRAIARILVEAVDRSATAAAVLGDQDLVPQQVLKHHDRVDGGSDSKYWVGAP